MTHALCSDRARGRPDPLAGRLCRVLLQAHGPGPHNQLIELEDGTRLVVTRRALRVARGKDRQQTLL